jgi:hypothetical protein
MPVVRTTIYFNGGARVKVEGSAGDLKRKLSRGAIADFTDTTGNRIRVLRDSVYYWREKQS